MTDRTFSDALSDLTVAGVTATIAVHDATLNLPEFPHCPVAQDTDGVELRAGDRIVIYRPGVTETADVLGLVHVLGGRPCVEVRHNDGVRRAVPLNDNGRVALPPGWRIALAAWYDR